MATIRKIFSYDDLEDKDIGDWIDSLPQREQSKHIRIAIRAYINYLQDQEQGSEPIKTPTRKATVEIKEEPKRTNDEDEFVDINDNFLDDLGK